MRRMCFSCRWIPAALMALCFQSGGAVAVGAPTEKAAGRERPASVVSVLDFGAVGDGVADDTAAIPAGVE